MKVLIELNHPAHYHLLKNTIGKLIKKGIKCFIVAQTKDVLTHILDEDGVEYINIKQKRRKKTSWLILAFELVVKNLKMLKIVLREKPDVMIGTSYSICHIGKLLNIPSFILQEDDSDVIPIFAKLAYPFATGIIVPDVCSVGKWEKKKISYKGYHELAYLHPNNFTPNIDIVNKYVDNSSDYFIVRLAKLTAHHDKGINGINNDIAVKIVEYLSNYGKVLITSERELPLSLEKYRLNINPSDIHHLLAFTKLFIGDSQTMAAEAGVLGTPFIRFNDFVGRIGYLNDIENKYELGYGFKTDKTEEMFNKLVEITNNKNLKEIWEDKKNIMLNDKIDVNKFLFWFLSEFPDSYKSMKI